MRKTPVHGSLAEAASAVAAAMREEFGKGAMARLSDPDPYGEESLVIPTGIASLDAAIGVGGWPGARVVELYGGESSGKTTLTKHLASQAQKAGVLPAFADVEQSGVLAWDVGLGIKAAEALGGQPDTVEEVFAYAKQLCATHAKLKVPGLYIWDSLAATPCQAEFERDLDENGRMAERANVLSTLLRRGMVGMFKDANVGFVIVNQLRENPGAMPFQPKTYSPGGRAVRHAAHLRIELARIGQVKKAEQIVGIKVRAKVVKNKLAPPYREANFTILWEPQPTIVDGV